MLFKFLSCLIATLFQNFRFCITHFKSVSDFPFECFALILEKSAEFEFLEFPITNTYIRPGCKYLDFPRVKKNFSLFVFRYITFLALSKWCNISISSICLQIPSQQLATRNSHWCIVPYILYYIALLRARLLAPIGRDWYMLLTKCTSHEMETLLRLCF